MSRTRLSSRTPKSWSVPRQRSGWISRCPLPRKGQHSTAPSSVLAARGLRLSQSRGGIRGLSIPQQASPFTAEQISGRCVFHVKRARGVFSARSSAPVLAADRPRLRSPAARPSALGEGIFRSGSAQRRAATATNASSRGQASSGAPASTLASSDAPVTRSKRWTNRVNAAPTVRPLARRCSKPRPQRCSRRPCRRSAAAEKCTCRGLQPRGAPLVSARRMP
jgi:hypothetical protein